LQIAATVRIFKRESLFYWSLNVFGRRIWPASVQ